MGRNTAAEETTDGFRLSLLFRELGSKTFSMIIRVLVRRIKRVTSLSLPLPLYELQESEEEAQSPVSYEAGKGGKSDLPTQVLHEQQQYFPTRIR